MKKKLTEVLFVRTAPDLIRRLEQLRRKRQRQEPGRAISRADLVRELLYEALAK